MMLITNSPSLTKTDTTKVLCSVLLLFVASSAMAQALPAIDNKGTIRTIYNGLRDWVLTGAYVQGQFVVRNNIIYRANANIAANTAFVEGTTGATWTLISGTDGNHVVGTVVGTKPDTTPAAPTAANLPTDPVNGDSVTEVYDDFVVHYSYNGTNWTSAAYPITSLWDKDMNTGIQVEERADENKIRFDTAGEERMIIDENGNVGINTTTPTNQFQVNRPLAPTIGPATNTTIATVPNNGSWTTLIADISTVTNITPVGLSFATINFNGNPGVASFSSLNTTTNGIVVADATTIIDNLRASYWLYRVDNPFIKALKVEFRLNGDALEAREQNARYRNGTSVPAANRIDAYFSGTGWNNGGYRFDLVRVSSQSLTPSDGAIILTAVSETANVGVGVLSPTDKLHVSGNTRIEGALKDSNNEAGTAGQVLSSTATGTDWIDSTSLQDGNQTFETLTTAHPTTIPTTPASPPASPLTGDTHMVMYTDYIVNYGYNGSAWAIASEYAIIGSEERLTDKINAAIEKARPRVFKELDDIERTFGTSWGTGFTTTTRTIRDGWDIDFHYELPSRNDAFSWGGGYAEVQYAINGGAFQTFGQSGYQLAMGDSAKIIRTDTRTLLLTRAQLSAPASGDFTIQFRFRFRSYGGTLRINAGRGTNDKDFASLFIIRETKFE